MTYNIKYDDKGDSPESWVNRKSGVVGVLRHHSPDLIGTQEGLLNQLEYIDSQLGDYSWFGVGREGEDEGEFSAIFYRNDRFTLLEHDTFWLSTSPNQPGSKSWDAAFPRIVTWGKLREERTGQEFYLFNTHFDHRGDTARRRSAQLLLQKIGKIASGPNVMVTGDFNAVESAEPYKILVGKLKSTANLHLLDTFYQSRFPHHGPDATFSGFKVDPDALKRRIDYIFIKPDSEFDVINHSTITDFSGGYYPSDHLPVTVDLRISD